MLETEPTKAMPITMVAARIPRAPVPQTAHQHAPRRPIANGTRIRKEKPAHPEPSRKHIAILRKKFI
jgi:hypothetical protein